MSIRTGASLYQAFHNIQMTILTCNKERRATILKSTSIIWYDIYRGQNNVIASESHLIICALNGSPFTYYTARVHDRGMLQEQIRDIHIAALGSKEQCRRPGLKIRDRCYRYKFTVTSSMHDRATIQ